MQQFCETSLILNVTTSKTKQFCETSSFFEVDNIKNEAILPDFLQKWKVECRADGLVPIRFAIFPLHLSKVLRLPRKSEARSYEVLHLSRHVTCLLYCACHGKKHLCRSSSNVPRLPSFLEMLQNSHVLLTFDKVWQGANPLRLPHETTSERPKVVRTCSAFNILTSKRASRHIGVHFFDISTSKSGPTLVCFVHFDLDTCFAPQQRALFRHLNFQTCSDTEVLCTFWLPNALCATTACNFSSLIWPPAALASLLFDPPEPQIIVTNTVNRDFSTFSRTCSFFLLRLFLFWSSSSLIRSGSSHLCFSICPYCRKFDF